MTLLTIIQDACNQAGLSAPSSVVGNTDLTAKQMLALSNRSGKMLAQRFEWQELVVEATHTTIAAELQGAVEAILPGFNWYLYETMWNRTNRNYLWGPLYPKEWQFLKASNVSGPFPEFRIRDKNLYFLPVTSAGETIGLEYVSRYWCESSGGTDQERWAADTDVGKLSEDMLTLDLVWRFKAAKGFDYAEDKLEAEAYINNAMARSGARRKVNLAGDSRAYPDTPYGLRVQDGSWTP